MKDNLSFPPENKRNEPQLASADPSLRSYTKPLDTFRFFAFMIVFIGHQYAVGVPHLIIIGFFVMSGYLLVPKLYYSSGREANFFKYFLKFFRNRCLRIFPLYYLFVCLVLLGSRFDVFDFDVERSKFYLLSYSYNFYQLFNLENLDFSKELVHLWSLSVEEQMYVLLPVLIWLFGRKYNYMLAISAVLCLFLAYFFRDFISDNYYKNPHWVYSSIYIFSPLYISSFLVGGYFGINRCSIPTNLPLLIFFYVLLTAGGLLANYYLEGILPIRTLGYPHPLRYSYQWLWGYIAWSIFFAYLSLHLTKDDNILYKLLDISSIAYLGRISYGLYLFHFPVILIFNKYLEHKTIANVFISLMITILLSVVSYEFYEKRFLLMKSAPS